MSRCREASIVEKENVMDHPYSPSSLPIPATLLPAIIGIVLLCAPSLSAQRIPYDHRWISLRLFGESSEPLTDRSGAIRLVDPEYLDEDADRMASMPIFARFFRLPDREYLLARFPVDLEAIVDDTRMLLRLDADVDSIRLRDGIFHVPRPFEPFFGLRAAEGIRILEQDIACFEVADIENEPVWPTVDVDSLHPYRLIDRALPARDLPTPYPSLCNTESPWRAHMKVSAKDSMQWFSVDGITWQPATWKTIEVARKQAPTQQKWTSTTDSIRWVTTDGINWRPISDLPFFAESMAVFEQTFLDEMAGYTIAGRRIGHARDSSQQNLGTYRTEDGGMTWQNVEALSRQKICGLSPYRNDTAWFVGYGPWNPEGTVRKIRLYRGSLDGSKPTPIDWPSGFDPVAGASEEVTIVAIDEESLLIGTVRTGLHLVNVGTSTDRARLITTDFSSLHRAPDNSIWIAGRTIGTRHTERYYPHSLIRVAPDGNGWRTILQSIAAINGVTFFDRTLGALLGESWILLTVDGGKSWRYLPLDRGTRIPCFSRRSTSQAFFPDAETIRILDRNGSVDISLKDLPPPRFCVPIDEWRPGTDIE